MIFKEPILRDVLTIRTKQFGEEDLSTVKTKSLLGVCLTGLERFKEAEKYLTESYENLNRTDHWEELKKTLRRFIDLYEVLG